MAAIAVGLAVAGANLVSEAGRPGPRVYLWAWDRPEDLRFLKPPTGAAFLAKTIVLEGPAIAVRARLQPFRIPPGTPLIAVARIENGAAPALTPGQREAAAAALADLGSIPGISAVQVDYDALVSQRAFYADMLRDLRRRLPPGIKLSITALASWCTFDDWISGLPVDEAVPMLFRMGPDRDQILRRLRDGEDFRARPCRTSLGISTDEPLDRLPSGRRLYIFHPRAWTAEAGRLALRQAQTWQ